MTQRNKTPLPASLRAPRYVCPLCASGHDYRSPCASGGTLIIPALDWLYGLTEPVSARDPAGSPCDVCGVMGPRVVRTSTDEVLGALCATHLREFREGRPRGPADCGEALREFIAVHRAEACSRCTVIDMARRNLKMLGVPEPTTPTLTLEEINEEIRATRRERPGHRDYVVKPEHVVVIDYTNWKGVRRIRSIVPIPGSLTFRETPHHKPAQWVFDALDLERPEHPQRTFALRSIHSWSAP